ncbi:MAG: oligosaccharide flippase family protein [Rhodospirillales bacterium]
MVLNHALYYLTAAAMQAAAALGLVAALTRVLGDAEFGQYGLAAAALHLYQSILFFWLRASVSRFHAAAEHEGRLQPFLAGMRRWFLAAAGVGFALGACLVLLAPASPGLKATLWVMLAAATFLGAFTLVLELHRARLEARQFALYQSIQAAASVALSLALVLAFGHAAGGVYGAALAMGGLALSFLACVAIDPAGLRFWRGGGEPRPGDLGAVLAYGLPMTAAMVLDALLITADRFIIAHFLGEAGVAPYAAAQTLAQRSLAAICTVVGAAAAPLAFAAMERQGEAEARQRLTAAGELAFAVAVPAAFGLAAVAGPLCDVMVGETLRAEARLLLPWIAAGGLLQGLTVHYFQQGFLVARRPGALVLALLPAMAVYFAGNFALVPVMGAMGAAVSLVASQAVQLGFVIVAGRRHFAMPLCAGTAARAVLLSALMFAVLRALPLPGGAAGLAVQVAAGIAVYGLGALALDMAGCRAHAARLLRRRA